MDKMIFVVEVNTPGDGHCLYFGPHVSEARRIAFEFNERQPEDGWVARVRRLGNDED